VGDWIIPFTSAMEAVIPSSGASPEELVSASQLGLLLKEKEEEPPPRLDPLLVKRAIARLPDQERDCIDLTARGCLQSDIGAMLGLTQAAISYRLHRAQARLRWLLLEEGSLFSVAELRQALEKNGNFTIREMIFLAALWWTTSQTMANLHLGECGFTMWNQSYATQMCRPFVTGKRPGLITRLCRAPGMELYGRGFSSLAGFSPFKERRWNVLHFMDGCGMEPGKYRRPKPTT
jgi:Sigma-70, region 4